MTRYCNSLTLRDKLIAYSSKLDQSHAILSDKLRVKDVVTNLEVEGVHVVPLISVLTERSSLLSDDLPDDFVVKSNNGCGDLLIIKDKELVYASLRAQRLSLDSFDWNFWKSRAMIPHVTSTEKHYSMIKPEVYAEELLPSYPEAPLDFKFFCFNGQAKFAHVDKDRHVEHTRNFYDGNGDFMDIKLTYKNFKESISMSDYLEMLEIANKLSSNLNKEFVRVDLYKEDDKVYFGEFTFVPDAGYGFDVKPEHFNKELGDFWE